MQKQSYNEAIAEFKKAIELSGGSVPCTSNLAYAYSVSNKRNEAVKILNDLKCNVSRFSPELSQIQFCYF